MAVILKAGFRLPRLAFILSLLIFFALSSFAEMTADQRRAQLEAFDRVWETVREKHWDPAMGGIDWQAVRNELRPQVEHAATESEVRAIIGQMLSRLHQSHFQVIPGSVYHDVERPASAPASEKGEPSPPEGSDAGPEGGPGFDVRVANGDALVVSVEPNGSAIRGGVRTGWIVSRVDGEEISPMLRRVSAAFQDSTQKEMMLARSVMSRLEGPLANSVEVEFRDGHDKAHTLTMERQPLRGEPVKFGYLPESNFWVESRRVTPNVEYIGWNLFLDPAHLIPAIQSAVRDCAHCRGMILDLRGNPGGIGLLATGIAGYFITQPDQKLGTMYMRDLPLKFVVNPRPPVYEGPLAILVDGLSASTSEIFASGMQDLKRARIFGTRSAGAALPSLIERLPNGDGFQYAAASYKSESGKTLEGAGVTPDEETPITRAALLAGHDLALDASLRWMGEQSSKETRTQ